MTLGEKIKAARGILNMTRKDLAACTGISERTIYTYEQLGIIPRKGNLHKLADALHVSESYLTRESETDPGAELEEELFLREARKKYGTRGARQARAALDQITTLFAGGDLDDAAKEDFLRSVIEVYFSSKEQASKKFTPKSLRKSKISQDHTKE